VDYTENYWVRGKKKTYDVRSRASTAKKNEETVGRQFWRENFKKILMRQFTVAKNKLKDDKREQKKV